MWMAGLPLVAEDRVRGNGTCPPGFFLEKDKVSDINAKIVEIVAERLSVNADTVTSESSFINDLGADSLDIVELVMEFEEAFDIQIPDEDAESIRTVGEAVAYIQSNSGGGADAGGAGDGGGDKAAETTGKTEAAEAAPEEAEAAPAEEKSAGDGEAVTAEGGPDSVAPAAPSAEGAESDESDG